MRESFMNSLIDLNDSLPEWVLFKPVSHEQLQWCFTGLFHWLIIKNWFIRVIHSPVWQHGSYCVWWTLQNRPNWKVTQWVQWGSQLWIHRRLRMIHWLYESDSHEQFQWCFTNLFDSLKNQIARVIHLLIGQQSLWCIWWCLQKTRAFIVAT